MTTAAASPKKVIFRVDDGLSSEHCPKTDEGKSLDEFSFCTPECLDEHRKIYVGPGPDEIIY